MIQELLPLSLCTVPPVPLHTVVHPGTFHVLPRGHLHKLSAAAVVRVEVPHRLDVVVLSHVPREMVPVPGHDVDDPRGQVGRVKHLNT